MSSSGEGGSNNSAVLIVVADLKWRRERIATAVLAGLAAYPEPAASVSEMAKVAVEWADALIAELDKP